MMIHPTAIIETGAEIADGCRIGPYAYVGSGVRLGPQVEIEAFAKITGLTRIGNGTKIGSYCCIGDKPQDPKCPDDAVTTLVIGQCCVIRDRVTIETGQRGTVVEDRCFFMTGSGIGHDTWVEPRVTFSPLSFAAGHCLIGQGSVLGASAFVHQHTRIGAYAMIGAMCSVTRDIRPYGLVMIQPETYQHAHNLVGMRRLGMTNQQIQDIQQLATQQDAGDPGTIVGRWFHQPTRRGIMPLSRNRSCC